MTTDARRLHEAVRQGDDPALRAHATPDDWRRCAGPRRARGAVE
jgi:hypothetical protein